MIALLNFAAYQLGWFACILGAVYDQAVLGTLTGVAIVIWHLSRASRPGTESVMLLIVAAAGTVWESTLVGAGWIHYDSGVWVEGLAPYWITMLWALFATTFNVSLHWLRRRWFMAAVFSFLGAPAAFYAGERLGGLELVMMPDALLAQAIGYAVLVPVLLRLSLALDGYGYVPAMADTNTAREGGNLNV